MTVDLVPHHLHVIASRGDQIWKNMNQTHIHNAYTMLVS